MSKRMRVLMLVLAVLMIVPSILAGCGDSEDPATTTEATTAATTTAATTEAAKGLDGYEFFLSANGDGEIWTSQTEMTAEYQELLDAYAKIEEELNCSITIDAVDNSTEAMTAAAVGGIKIADFIMCRQSTWIPLAMMGGIRPLDGMVEAGLDLYNQDVFNQTYTMMTELKGPDGVAHVWALDMTGKYCNISLGHFYAFNKELTAQAGYDADTLYQKVRDGEWNYELFMEIARATTTDLDGDGVFDIHGVALDTDGNEIWTNGVKFIRFDDAQGKWISDCLNPQLMPALQFMSDLSGTDVQIPVFGNTAGRGDRRTNFYQGKATFAGLYGGNIEGDEYREMAGNGIAGILPLPKGPNADGYIMSIVDHDAYVCMASNQDWAKSIQVMNKLGTVLTDWDAFKAQVLDHCGGDEQAVEMLFDITLPNAIMNIAKASDALYQITRKDGFFSNIYELVLTPAAAAETWQDVIQAELDNVFQQ